MAYLLSSTKHTPFSIRRLDMPSGHPDNGLKNGTATGLASTPRSSTLTATFSQASPDDGDALALTFAQPVAPVEVEVAYFTAEPGKLKQNDKTAIY